ncbi:hypothetical protein LCGC14_3069740 [marine sediment metagenome]|uniref:Uncharacterized protein n=1 Tax=marine sediment metagenome TaxID=412755 RepID=A0A0F8WGG3_9ZZZZ
MRKKEKRKKDDILREKKLESLKTQSFLAALKENLDSETAFKIAKDAFEKYMTNFYGNIC